MVNEQAYTEINAFIKDKQATLVAVSKLKPASDVEKMYALGQRDFGENYVQELVEKQAQLPTDIHWHFIGHLQSNKVKYIAPFVNLIQSVDSEKLLKEINIPTDKFISSLFAFNLGIEGGQLIIVALAFPFIYFYKDKKWYPTAIKIFAIIISIIAMTWFFQRLFL